MGLKSGDSLSTWISCSEAAESYMVHLACYRAGIKVFALSSEEDLEKALSSTSALVFSPWEESNGLPRIDKVLEKVPTLLTTPTGSFVKSSHATKYFIQSGFKTIRGTYKLKSIPVYSPLLNPVDSFTYTYKGVTTQNDDFFKFAKDFSGKIVEGDRIVNGVACKEAFGFASVAAAVKIGVKSVSAVLGDSSAAVLHHNANVLVLTESKIDQIAEPCEVDKILIGIEKKEDLERVKALLEKKSVRAKIIFPYQIGNLSSLA